MKTLVTYIILVALALAAEAAYLKSCNSYTVRKGKYKLKIFLNIFYPSLKN